MVMAQPAVMSRTTRELLDKFLGDWVKRGFTIEDDGYGLALLHEGKVFGRLTMYSRASTIQEACHQHWNEHKNGVSFGATR